MMLGLPSSIEMRKQIPKDVFFKSKEIKGSEKQRFDQQVHKFTVVGIISPQTVNIESGADISAIYVIEIQLNTKQYDPRIIDSLERLGHKAIYLLSFDNLLQIAVKEGLLFHSDWKTEDGLNVELVGLNLDEVWANIVRRLGDLPDEGEFKDVIENAVRSAAIRNQIEVLEKKMAKEKQNHVLRELYAQIQELKQSLK